MSVVELARARDRLRRVDAQRRSSAQVCEALIGVLHEVAHFTAAAVMVVDPETMLPSGGAVEGFAPDAWAAFWDNELADPDFNKFNDLSRRIDTVATLAEATDGDLIRSPRATKLFAPAGLGDELRIAFVAGGGCLAIASLVRPADDGDFTAQELTDVRALVPTATASLRRANGHLTGSLELQPPAVILLDSFGRVAKMSASGQEVLDDLRVNGVDGDFPGILQVAMTKARWSRHGTDLSTRVRGRSGRWMRLHVTTMEGDDATVVLTVESAGPDDLARILLDSYGLTSRETEIVIRLCRGMTSKEIGAELFISAHTVRDHIKAIYEKADVNSRGELVAGLFSAHVLGQMHDEVVQVGVGRTPPIDVTP